MVDAYYYIMQISDDFLGRVYFTFNLTDPDSPYYVAVVSKPYILDYLICCASDQQLVGLAMMNCAIMSWKRSTKTMS